MSPPLKQLLKCGTNRKAFYSEGPAACRYTAARHFQPSYARLYSRPIDVGEDAETLRKYRVLNASASCKSFKSFHVSIEKVSPDGCRLFFPPQCGSKRRSDEGAGVWELPTFTVRSLTPTSRREQKLTCVTVSTLFRSLVCREVRTHLH